MKGKYITTGLTESMFTVCANNRPAVKVCLQSLLVCLFMLQGFASRCQYIEFTENKGQWDSSLAFKGDYGAGSVGIKPDGGYRVLLNNRDDLRKISAYLHGTAPKGATGKASTTLATTGAATTGGIVLHSHIYEVSFAHANTHPVAIPEKRQAKYNNYFIGSNPAKWAGKCAVYDAVTFKDVYPGIDVHYYTSGGNFKYDIIVNSGGDISKVALNIAGADSLGIKNGDMVVKTSVDEVKELAPNSYAVTSEGNKPLKCKYNLKGNTVTFKFSDAIKPGTPVIIDPTLIFCSFSGSTADNWGYTATYDASGNFYAGGIVFANGFKITNGAFQKTFAGGNNNTGEGSQRGDIDLNGFDMGIMKFNSAGTSAMYATYIGGADGNEQPHSLVTDGAGNLIIAGRTTSADYPTLAPDTIGPCGNQDIVLTKLSADGSSLIGSLRIGGSADDGVNMHSKDLPPYGTDTINRNYGDDARSEVILDNAGNICLASCTKSTDFPLYNALFSTLGGTQDAVLLKFPPNLNAKPFFSTYLGGSSPDAAFVLAQNPVTSDLYVGGATASSNFPGTSGVASAPLSGVFLGGPCDGFVSIIKDDGSQLVKTVYFGTGSADQIYGIDFNASGDPFIMGTTEGLVTPVNSTFNANGNQSQGKQFITKLSPDLTSIIYSANFGPANIPYPNISPTAFLVDICENVYVSGWGGGLDGTDAGYSNSGPTGLTAVASGQTSRQLSSTPIKVDAGGPPQVACFYFFVLQKNATAQLYGAFLGDPSDYNGTHVDGGTSRFDKNGVIYQAVCACGPDNNLPTGGAAYTQNGAYLSGNGYSCNLTSIKIAFNFAGVGASVKSSINGIADNNTGCTPLTVTFYDTIGNAKTYLWDYGDGSGQVITSDTVTHHTYSQIGTYSVMLVAVDSTTCNIRDTSYTTIRVRNDNASVAYTFTKLQPCDSFNYVFTNNSVPSTGKSFTDSSFTWNFGDGSTAIAGTGPINHHYVSPGTYNVELTLTDTNFCNAPQVDSLQLRISAIFTALFTTPAVGCAPYTAQFTNTSIGGQTFLWSFGDGTTSTQTSPSHLYPTPGSYNVELVGVDSSTCNIADSTSTIITVYSQPVPAFNFSPQQAQENTPVTLTNLTTGATSYRWNFGDGTFLSTTADTPVSHIYVKTGTYNVCLVAYNAAGCADSVCQEVPAIIVPLVDVPNALTPNGDGINDEVHVRGFGIEKMDWKIYDRWGKMVFESTDQNIGWDGKYKGVLQPQDVYVYVLEVEYSDGTKYQKKGDITLLR